MEHCHAAAGYRCIYVASNAFSSHLASSPRVCRQEAKPVADRPDAAEGFEQFRNSPNCISLGRARRFTRSRPISSRLQPPAPPHQFNSIFAIERKCLRKLNRPHRPNEQRHPGPDLSFCALDQLQGVQALCSTEGCEDCGVSANC
jgi:hypothetical protein